MKGQRFVIMLTMWIRVARSADLCDQDALDQSIVSQCATKLCEQVVDSQELQNYWPSSSKEIVHVVSSRDSKHRFSIKVLNAESNDEHYYEESHLNVTLFVDTNVEYQKMLGFGTTLSDSACKNYLDLPENLRELLIRDYFNHESGIGLSFVKVPIGSTMNSFTNYVLEDTDNSYQDITLSGLDTECRIPLIQSAVKAAGNTKAKIRVVASSSSAPAELKRNKNITDGDYLLDNKINDYASYLNSYIEEMKRNDIDLWSLTLSDKPFTVASANRSNLNYNSMAMTVPQTMSLAKAIEASRKERRINRCRLLLMGDDRKYMKALADQVKQFAPEIIKLIAGVAYDCDKSPYDSLLVANRAFRGKYLIATASDTNKPMKLGDWQHAENYADQLVKSIEFGTDAWIDKNMALDMAGGPALRREFKADSPIIVDSAGKRYFRNPSFYAIGHLSKFVKPGSIRVKTTFTAAPLMHKSQAVAFKTPDNYVVVFMANNNINPMSVVIGSNKNTKLQVMLDTKSFNTFIFRV